MDALQIEKIKRGLLLFIAVMTAVMGYYIWVFNHKSAPVKPISTPVKSEADVVANDVELRETSGKRTLWELQAKKAEVFNLNQETLLEDIELEFYDQQGRKNMHLTSDRGIYDNETGNIIATGNVQATSYKDGILLKTSELIYDAEAQKIRSEEHVIIERGDVIISGEGLESDPSLTEAKILRNITTSFK